MAKKQRHHWQTNNSGHYPNMRNTYTDVVTYNDNDRGRMTHDHMVSVSNQQRIDEYNKQEELRQFARDIWNSKSCENFHKKEPDIEWTLDPNEYITLDGVKYYEILGPKV